MLYYKEMNRLRFDVPTITRCDMIKGLLSNGDLSGALYIRRLLNVQYTIVLLSFEHLNTIFMSWLETHSIYICIFP